MGLKKCVLIDLGYIDRFSKKLSEKTQFVEPQNNDKYALCNIKVDLLVTKFYSFNILSINFHIVYLNSVSVNACDHIKYLHCIISELYFNKSPIASFLNLLSPSRLKTQDFSPRWSNFLRLFIRNSIKFLILTYINQL